MKLRYIIFLLMALSCLTFAQKKRYLISPRQEVIPIDKNESARLLMESKSRAHTVQSTNACSNSVLDGFTPVPYESYINSRFGGYHKDVFGEWFVAKYTGTLDTMFWYSANEDVGAKDSLVFIRIHQSIIGPNFGPGVRPGPYNPPCQNWGYWRNSNDLDQGVAAFIDDATDTTWYSTIAGSTPTTPPFGRELWGMGGYPVVYRAFQYLHVALADLMPLSITSGDLFFVSMRVNGKAEHIVDPARTAFYAGEVDSRLSEFREYYPTRIWKFYEHDSGPSNCAGVPVNEVKRGWVARGGFTTDTLTVAFYNWWFSMTTNDNTPPQLLSSETIHHTFSNDPQTVAAEIEDCDPSNPAEALVASVYVNYTATSSIDGSSTTGRVDLVNTGGNSWEGAIPGQPKWTEVTWTIVATDNKGLISIFPQTSYRIVGEDNEFATEDGGSAFGLKKSVGCDDVNIASTGTEILSSQFFRAATQADTICGKDDGTAGPFALSTPFYLYGEPFNYVWVGVNGALALSKEATDTNDVNANGSYTTGWTMPGLIRTGSNRDTGATSRKPRFFIAGSWQDYFYGNCIEGDQYGHIYYQDDPCTFTLQYGPGFGVFGDDGSFVAESLRFAIILNKCDGTIKFNYHNFDEVGLDTLNQLVGISADTLKAFGKAPWFLVSRDHYPVEYDPAPGTCFTIYQKASTMVLDKWNMVSVSNVPKDNNYAKANVFPTAISSAFKYAAGYTAIDPLTNGNGMWVKFSGTQVVGVGGTLLLNLDVPVNEGWNLIGTPSCGIATTSITRPAVAGKTFFGYSTSGYTPVTVLETGKAYWVKSDSVASIAMACGTPAVAKPDQNYSQLNGFNTISVRDSRGGDRTLYLGNESLLKVPADRYELPPLPMVEAFDARFSSNKAVETYSSEAGKVTEYTIHIQSNAYPVALQYNIVDKSKSLVISENGNAGKSLSNSVLSGQGVIRLTNPAVTSVKVRVIDNGGKPTVYALSQNYPNPFNPVTRFSVDIPSYSDVTVTVFDILGHKVATLLSGQHDAGTMTIEWDGKDQQGVSASSGVYFVRMSAGNFSEVRKIMLLK